MRWDALFGDLDAQWHAAKQLDLETEINELARLELAQSTFADALRGSLGAEVTAVLCNGVVLHGSLSRVEAQWLLLASGSRSIIVPLAKLRRITGAGSSLAPARTPVAYTLASAMRVLSRNRSVVNLDLDGPAPGTVRGVLDRVGADYVQLAVVTDGAARSQDNHAGTMLIPLQGIVSVASSAENEF
jgi:sRNA-binding regulator protein Hfq